MEMVKIIRNSLWSSQSSQKLPVVAWHKVCLPHKAGGLNIRSLQDVVQAFRAKQLNKLIQHSNALRPCVMHAKYGPQPLAFRQTSCSLTLRRLQVCDALKFHWRKVFCPQ